MHIILLTLGVIVAIAGAGMIVFGIANNPFDIGTTMISAGTTGLVGGLVIVALANLARELQAARQPEVRKSSRAPAAPAPSRQAPAEKPSQAPAEKPSQAAAGPADLSQVLAEPLAEPAPAEPRIEPIAPVPPASAPSVSAPPAGDPFAPARADPARRAASRERSFDAVWAPEPAKPAPAAGRPAPDVRPAPEPARESESVAIRPPREPQAVSVLKSGVIEGMAYTLYSDGSIEADLPQGMMRFPSIDALRRHLAGHG
jgi:hypothetical protein